MTNPNISLETTVPKLPYGYASYFDWEIDGVRYRYTVKTSGLCYVGRDLKVYGDVRIEKRVYKHWWRVQWLRTIWSVVTVMHVDILDRHNVETGLLGPAAKAGVVPSDLLLDKCCKLAQEPLEPLRSAAVAALYSKANAPSLRTA